jgi:serine/threonine-protein kinase
MRGTVTVCRAEREVHELHVCEQYPPGVAVPHVTDRVGQVLGGRYRLVAPVGTGASASVYLADDVTLRRRVAVKVLHPALADDEAFLRRFRAEAQSAASFADPHLLAVYDWGEDDGEPYLVTEFLAGGSLRSMLDADRVLSLSQALLVGLETAKGLDAAHRRGFVHRDIKPGNLLFDADARLRIADFGLARALAEAAWTEPMGAVLGTARYASPEQARGEALDGRSDVYSLAVVVIEAATGRTPFAADTSLGTLMARADQHLPVPELLGPLVPALEAAGTPDPTARCDAATFGRMLSTAAKRLDRPAPLPLVGFRTAEDDRDPTDLAGVAAPVRSSEPDTEVVDLADAAAVAAVAGAATSVAAPGATATSAAAQAGDTLFDVELDDHPEAPTDAATPRSSSRTGRRRGRWLIGILVVLAVAGGAAWYVAQPTVVALPDLVGGDRAAAEAVATEHGWFLVVAEDFSATAPAGTVLAQNPEPGTELEGRATVELTVSRGPPPVPVPVDLVGLPLADAEVRLVDVGLTLGDQTPVFDEEVPAGSVVALADGIPAELPPGSSVALVVSDGPEPRTIPSGLAGRDGVTVRQELEALGLVVAVATDYSDEVAEGDVLGTNPQPGQQVPRGGEVVLIVSAGPPVVEVGSVNGLSVVEAAAALEAQGLVVGGTQGSPTRPAAGTDPAAGTTVRVGSSVTIITG